MLDAVSHTHIIVRDQDEAKAFYTEVLGLEVRQDVTLEEMGGYRWLTVGPPDQPDMNLMLLPPGPQIDEQTREQVLQLVAQGATGGGIFRTDDCRATCRELEGRGLELTQQPDERFYGIDAAFRDPSGNQWRIVQPIEFDPNELERSAAASG